MLAKFLSRWEVLTPSGLVFLSIATAGLQGHEVQHTLRPLTYFWRLEDFLNIFKSRHIRDMILLLFQEEKQESNPSRPQPRWRPFEHFSARPCRRLSLFLDVCGSQSLAMKTNSTKRVHWVHIVSLSLTSEILLYSSLIRSSASYEMKSFRNQRRPVWIYLIGFDWSTYWAPSLKASAARTML